MKRALLIFALLLMATPSAARATQNPGAAPQLDAKNDPNGPIPSEIVNKWYGDCRYNISARFTPRSREYYCACNAAALQGNFVNKEFNELQRKSAQTPQNKTYEKYLATAVGPCMDIPSEQISYLECLMDTSTDIRIGQPLQYCRCISRKVRKHVEKAAAPDIITRILTYPGVFTDPTDALWDSREYNISLSQARDTCLRDPTDRTGE